MGIIGRDGRELFPGGEGMICPRIRGGGRPPTMNGRTHAAAWRTVPQTPYATTPMGGPLGKFGSLGMMGDDDGRAPLHRDATNLTPPRHTFPHKGGPLEKNLLQPGHAFIPRGEPLAKFGSSGRMDTNQGCAPLRRSNHSSLSSHDP